RSMRYILFSGREGGAYLRAPFRRRGQDRLLVERRRAPGQQEPLPVHPDIRDVRGFRGVDDRRINPVGGDSRTPRVLEGLDVGVGNVDRDEIRLLPGLERADLRGEAEGLRATERRRGDERGRWKHRRVLARDLGKL